MHNLLPQALIINFLGFFFKVVPLSGTEWAVTVAIGVSSIPVSLATRAVCRRGFLTAAQSYLQAVVTGA